MIGSKQLEELLEVVDQASILLKTNKKNKFNIFYKDDGSECTELDLLSDQIICSHLRKNFPNDAIISEERVIEIDSHKLNNLDYIWMIDPLDGTRSYIKGGLSYSIHIALLFKGQPVFGLINIPEEDTTYYCLDGVLFKRIERHVSKISSKSYQEGNTNIVISRRSDPDKIRDYLQDGYSYKLNIVGGAKKFIGLAIGEFDLFPRYTPTSEWDIVAGDAILRCVGGGIYDSKGERVKYLKKDFANNTLFSCRDDRYLKFFRFC